MIPSSNLISRLPCNVFCSVIWKIMLRHFLKDFVLENSFIDPILLYCLRERQNRESRKHWKRVTIKVILMMLYFYYAIMLCSSVRICSILYVFCFVLHLVVLCLWWHKVHRFKYFNSNTLSLRILINGWIGRTLHTINRHTNKFVSRSRETFSVDLLNLKKIFFLL